MHHQKRQPPIHRQGEVVNITSSIRSAQLRGVSHEGQHKGARFRRSWLIAIVACVPLVGAVPAFATTTDQPPSATVPSSSAPAAPAVAPNASVSPATVTTYTIHEGITQNQKSYDSNNSHYIGASGGSIQVNKTDGPQIDVSWFLCGKPGTGGSWVSYANADPTGYHTIGTNFVNGSQYCIASWDHGQNPSDTWTGTGKS